MKNSYSSKLILKPAKILGKAAKKQLEYFNPKGASNRVLSTNLRKPLIEFAKISLKPSSEKYYLKKKKYSKYPYSSLKLIKNHSDLQKSTKLLENLILIPKEDNFTRFPSINNRSRDLTPQPSFPRLEQISEILDSCDKISRLNRSDIIIANSLAKESKSVHERAEGLINDSSTSDDGRGAWNNDYLKKRPNRFSIEKIKSESFKTACFVEMKLRKITVRKLKEKIMPWKKVTIDPLP